MSNVDRPPSLGSPRLSFLTLQHVKILEPFFSLPSLKERKESVALLPFSAVPRVWLPFLRFFQSQRSVKASFSSLRSWVSPFRALLPTGDRTILSNHSLRSCTSLENLSAFYLRFSAFIPPLEPSSFMLPEGLIRVGPFCSLGLFNLSGSPSIDRAPKSSPFQGSLLVS